MRLISEDGTMDVPYDGCVLIVADGSIIASPIASGAVEQMVMGEYYSDEMAKKVLKDIRGANALGHIAYTLPKPEGVKE